MIDTLLSDLCASLTWKQRVIVILLRLRGEWMTMQEIAQALGSGVTSSNQTADLDTILRKGFIERCGARATGYKFRIKQ